MNILPKAVTDAIESLSDLPGIGTRSAERLVFSLLRNNSGLDEKLAGALGNLRKSVRECEACCHLCEGKHCAICEDPSRDNKILCIVETPMDLIALERTHEFRGRYHVLHGVISPLDRVAASDLRIEQLFERVKNAEELEEIILATSGTTESEATAMFLAEQLRKIFDKRITRLARGIPSGSDLDYLDVGTLSRAITERREL